MRAKAQKGEWACERGGVRPVLGCIEVYMHAHVCVCVGGGFAYGKKGCRARCR